MRKAIIILTGISEGKTKFVNTIRENGYWTWNINHMNFLSSLTHKLFWDGVRNDKYYEFIKKFESIANEYYNYNLLYAERLIEKLFKSDKTTIVVIHSSNAEMRKTLLEKYENCYDIHIVNNNGGDYECYKSLNCENESYVEDLLKIVEELTIEKESE